jgi:hypothetical protein
MGGPQHITKSTSNSHDDVPPFHCTAQSTCLVCLAIPGVETPATQPPMHTCPCLCLPGHTTLPTYTCTIEGTRCTVTQSLGCTHMAPWRALHRLPTRSQTCLYATDPLTCADLIWDRRSGGGAQCCVTATPTPQLHEGAERQVIQAGFKLLVSTNLRLKSTHAHLSANGDANNQHALNKHAKNNTCA